MREDKTLAKEQDGTEKEMQKVQDVIPVNTKAKDTFFKKVYENEERQRSLVSFLLGKVPTNISTVAEYLQLVLDRGIFVDLLSDKEVCDMTMAQFSRDDILIYQGREEGREEDREEGLEEGREEGKTLHLIKTVYKKMLKGKTNEEISDEAEEEIIVIEQIKKAIIAYKKDHDSEGIDDNKVLEYYKEQIVKSNAKG